MSVVAVATKNPAVFANVGVVNVPLTVSNVGENMELSDHT